MEANIAPLWGREQLDFVNNVSSLLGSNESSRDFREALVRIAFRDDPKLLAETLMKIGAQA